MNASLNFQIQSGSIRTDAAGTVPQLLSRFDKTATNVSCRAHRTTGGCAISCASFIIVTTIIASFEKAEKTSASSIATTAKTAANTSRTCPPIFHQYSWSHSKSVEVSGPNPLQHHCQSDRLSPRQTVRAPACSTRWAAASSISTFRE